MTAGVRTNYGRVALRHRFHTTDIETIYRMTRLAKGATIAIRLPVWGSRSSIAVRQGAIRQGGRLVRDRLTAEPRRADDRRRADAGPVRRHPAVGQDRVRHPPCRRVPPGWRPAGDHHVRPRRSPAAHVVTRRINVTTAK